MIMHNNGWSNDNNYASKGLANGLGIPALVLGGLAFANQWCGNGGGGLFGGGCNNNSAILAENGELKAIINTKEEIANLKKDLLQGWIKPIADEVAENKTRVAVLQKDIECCCTANATAIAQVSKILNGITSTVIPNSAICPGWGPVLTSTVVTDPKATAVNVIGTVANKAK